MNQGRFAKKPNPIFEASLNNLIENDSTEVLSKSANK